MPPTKSPLVQIDLIGAEVPGEPRAVGRSWDDAHAVLREWGRTAPQAGEGYHKCDFTLTFRNQKQYSGRFDLRAGGVESDGSDLQAHVRAFCQFHSGRWCPPHLSPERYKAVLDQLDEGTKSHYADILDTCDLGLPPDPQVLLDTRKWERVQERREAVAKMY